jgi:ABC-type Fe3+-citrate transport system substrate-binding protein
MAELENNDKKIAEIKESIRRIDEAIKVLPVGIERELQIRNREFFVAQLFKILPLHEIMKYTNL